VNELSPAQEQADSTLLVSTEDGDRKIVFKQDLKLEFSNNTTQVLELVTQGWGY